MIRNAGATGALRVGLAGAGWVARHHLDAWTRLAGRTRVLAIADPSSIGVTRTTLSVGNSEPANAISSRPDGEHIVGDKSGIDGVHAPHGSDQEA